MNRDEFMELVYETFADEPDNVLANGIIEAADAYAEHEKEQLSQECTTSDLIDRQATLETLRTMQTYKLHEDDDMILVDKADVQTELMMMPSAQPETAKRIVGKSRDGMTLWYQCDMCNEPVDEQDDYCRGCGRRLIDG